ncbi:hypothetical protein WUBG_08814, partial [Wuchereria bancrofti]
AESTYIGLPNLYNCINAKSQKYYYNIPSPIVEKYVIEGTKTDNEQTEHKIAEAKKTFKKFQMCSNFLLRMNTPLRLVMHRKHIHRIISTLQQLNRNMLSMLANFILLSEK